MNPGTWSIGSNCLRKLRTRAGLSEAPAAQLVLLPQDSLPTPENKTKQNKKEKYRNKKNSTQRKKVTKMLRAAGILGQRRVTAPRSNFPGLGLGSFLSLHEVRLPLVLRASFPFVSSGFTMYTMFFPDLVRDPHSGVGFRSYMQNARSMFGSLNRGS